MTNSQILGTIEATNPVLTVAPPKEETEILGKLLLFIADYPKRMSVPASPCQSRISA